MSRFTVRIAMISALGLMSSLAACDKSKSPDSSASADKGGGADKVAKAGGEGDKGAGEDSADKGKVKVVDGPPPGEDERYALEFDTPEAAVGEEGKVTVRVVPKEPWHMNLDYPTSLKVEAPDGVALTKAELKKSDAKKLDEKSCEFDVAFTPDKAGDATLTGEFKFAVCQDEACSPVTESVEVKVAVK
jgi:hypothetical protein